MKKLILSFILLVLMTSFAFSKIKFVDEQETMPAELEGVWYAIEYSIDQGVTWSQDSTVLFRISGNHVYVENTLIVVTGVKTYTENNHILKVLNTTDPSKVLTFEYIDINNTVMFQNFIDNKEVLRVFIQKRR
jgi:hypothetical protein